MRPAAALGNSNPFLSSLKAAEWRCDRFGGSAPCCRGEDRPVWGRPESGARVRRPASAGPRVPRAADAKPRHSRHLGSGRRCARTGWVELKSGRVKQGRRLCRRAWWGARAKAQIGQDALDHRRIDDGGDNLQLAATVRGLFEVDGEDALEQPRPTQARRSVASASSRGRTR